ncbi:hypothetical protein ACIBQ6_19685 [Nonomuraea sp. NPDC049655]|uniref:hypothetical protein n=1 Tax=Nonomuraea sp. NPDC049655 TaxID=3364355 RepID=UPI0037B126F4
MLVTYPVRVDPHLPRNGHLAKPDGSYTTSSNPSAMQQNIVNGMNNGIMSGFGILFDPLTELFTWGEGDYYGWVNATYPVDGDSFTGGVSKGTGSLLPGLATMGLGTTARAGVLAPEVLAARASTSESAARAPGKELVKVEWPANRGFLGTPVKETLKPGPGAGGAPGAGESGTGDTAGCTVNSSGSAIRSVRRPYDGSSAVCASVQLPETLTPRGGSSCAPRRKACRPLISSTSTRFP